LGCEKYWLSHVCYMGVCETFVTYQLKVSLKQLIHAR
jgi:hypothetical protein